MSDSLLKNPAKMIFHRVHFLGFILFINKLPPPVKSRIVAGKMCINKLLLSMISGIVAGKMLINELPLFI